MNYKFLFLLLCTLGLSAGAMESNEKQPSKCLIEAILQGNEKEVENFIQAGEDVNVRGEGGWTGLMSASRDGFESIVQLLLKSAQVNIKSDRGVTALMLAVCNGHLSIVQRLIESGADINLQSMNDDIGLRYVANVGSKAHKACWEVIVEAMLRQLTDQQKKMACTFLSCMKFGDDYKGCYAALKHVYVQYLLRPMIRRENVERVRGEIMNIEKDQVKQYLLEKFFPELQKSNGDTNEKL